MGEFTTLGFPDYPNLHLDREAVHGVTEWSDEHLNYKIGQYRQFKHRPNTLPGHMRRAEDISNHLEFEGDCRDGIYEFIGLLTSADIQKLEDETCE